MTEIEQAAEVLKNGGVVVYPTDTTYGLAVDATNSKAINKLYKLKGRDFNKPIHVIFPSLLRASKIVTLNSTARKIIEKYWPGPLTVVLPIKAWSESWRKLSAKTSTLGIRYPENSIALELSKLFDKPITATSANISDQPNSYSINEVKKQFSNSKLKPDFYLDGGKLKNRPSSTIIQIDGRHVTLLREGPIKYHEILQDLV